VVSKHKTQTPSPNPEPGLPVRSAKDPLIQKRDKILRSTSLSNQNLLLKLRIAAYRTHPLRMLAREQGCCSESLLLR